MTNWNKPRINLWTNQLNKSKRSYLHNKRKKLRLERSFLRRQSSLKLKYLIRSSVDLLT
jgi:hypothetical protein